jgi:hypothetical protein
MVLGLVKLVQPGLQLYEPLLLLESGQCLLCHALLPNDLPISVSQVELQVRVVKLIVYVLEAVLTELDGNDEPF